MKFTTEIPIVPAKHQIQVDDSICLVGSCFAQEVGQWFLQRRFDVQVNPFGILFHPSVISRCLRRAIRNQHYELGEFVSNSNLHHSFDFHGSFSSRSAAELRDMTSRVIEVTHSSIQTASSLIITWGSACGYKWKDDGNWVSNCHKIPQSHFAKELISVSEITREYQLLFNELRALNPGLQIIISVSPVRYWRDGAHGNQLSKAQLLLAASQLADENEHVHYFPAYEIMMDELRDYRFYNADMLHPTPQAVEYIIGKFREMFFALKTNEYIHHFEPLRKFLAHRPLHVPDHEWLKLCEAKVLEIEKLRAAFA
jgi:hypothetical protein